MNKKCLQLLQMLECGDIALSQAIPKAFVILGMTKRGKTTSGHYLCNLPLQAKVTNSNISLVPTTKTYLKAKVGQSHNSQTQIPNYFKTIVNGKEMLIVDCPGYEDTYGCYRLITNGYFRYRVFSKVSEVKFIIVLQESDLYGSLSELKTTIVNFVESFNNFKEVRSDVLQACVLLITKVSKDVNEKNIMENLSGIIQTFKCSLSQELTIHFKDILRFIVEKKKIFIIRKPNANDKIDTRNTMLADIDARTKYWTRENGLNGFVDMSSISFNILDEVQKHRKDGQYWSELMSLLDTFQQKFKSVMTEGIKKTFQTIIKDATKDEDSHSFIHLMEKFVNQHYFFKEDHNNERNALRKVLFMPQISEKKLPQNYQIKKFRIADLISTIFDQRLQQSQIQVSQLKFEKRSQKWIERIQKKVVSVLRNLPIISYQKKQIEQVITKYSYIVFRMFEELKIFFLLFNKGSEGRKGKVFLEQFPDFIFPIDDIFNSVLKQDFIEVKIKFALQFQARSDKFSQQWLDFHEEITKSNSSLKIKLAKLFIPHARQRLSSNLKPEDAFQIFQKLNNSRKFFEQLYTENAIQNQPKIEEKSEVYLRNREKQKQSIVQQLFEISKLQGQFCKSYKLYEEGRISYESIIDVQNTIQIFKLQIQASNDDKKRRLLIELAQYSASKCGIHFAIHKLQQAHSLSKNYNQIKEVLDLIFQYSTSQLAVESQSYLMNLVRRSYYTPLSLINFNKLTSVTLKHVIQNSSPQKSPLSDRKNSGISLIRTSQPRSRLFSRVD